ncbi:unnamed protein product, partial [Rotaria sordida]
IPPPTSLATAHYDIIFKLAQIFPDGVVRVITNKVVLICCGIGRGF